MVALNNHLGVRFSLDAERITVYYNGKELATKLVGTVLRHFTDWELGGVYLPYSDVQALKKIIRERQLHGHV